MTSGTLGIVGIKRGMTRIFTPEGESIPVTVIEATPNRVTQRKTVEKDGYDAVQVTSGDVKSSRVNKPQAGHFRKANVAVDVPLPGSEILRFKIPTPISSCPWTMA